jgi:hypothetical protein
VKRWVICWVVGSSVGWLGEVLGGYVKCWVSLGWLGEALGEALGR